MSEYPQNIPLLEAMNIVLNEASPLSSEKISLTDSPGRVLKTDILAPHNVPPFDRSPFDGYAMRASDTQNASKTNPVTLNIIEEIRAGDAPRLSVKSGDAAKILTGAPIPDGADAVTKYEETEFDDKTVTIFEAFKSGSNIVYAGEDIKSGQIIAKSGSVIDPPLVGLLASLGVTEIDAIRRPKIALCTFGSELIGIDEPLTPGKIRNSNLYTFAAYLKNEGIIPAELGVVSDSVEPMAEMIKHGLDISDFLITTGGVSVGDYDLVRHAVTKLNGEILFWKTDIKPGSSVLVSKIGGKLVLSLSGNPAAAVIGYKTLGIPYLRKLMGYANPKPELVKLKLREPVTKSSPKTRMIPGFLKIIDNEAYFCKNSVQGNGVLSSVAGCELLGMIPAGSPPLESGTSIEVFMF